MPSVLIETGFISNEKEEAYLLSKQGQEYLSSAIYRAIKTYITNLENEENDEKNDIVQQTKFDNTAAITKSSEPDNNTNNLWFRVQVTSSSKPLKIDHPVFKNYTDIYEYYEKNMYKYTVGKYKNYDEVKSFQQKVRKDFPGAFIVAFNKNNHIDLKKALELIN